MIESASLGVAPIVIERLFDAPPALVFANWIEPENIRGWFAADDYETTTCSLDPRPGGAWRVDFLSRSGRAYYEHGVFQTIEAPHRLAFTLIQVEPDRSGPETLVSVSFDAVGDQTRMRFVQTGFEREDHRDGNAGGWAGCFDKLDAGLAQQRRRAPQ